ncbi:MAG: disulfide bond formation protein B [candidate division SR1 bacterium]|nr:disulfide bond formation protein B [candidate division SR1 bacterium]
MKPIAWLRLIFVQSLLAMAGSLYFSNFGDPIANIAHGNIFGGMGFEPCHLCRWARILMYPLVLISLIGLIRKDTKIAYTILPISAMGIILTGYHYIIQRVNGLNILSCGPGNPCTLIDWKIRGVITIPALARIAFVVIFVASLVIILHKKK